ncbi:MAG: hypothetical protein IT232_05100 [Flavobacteriales bacterium]|nr:hypothetical protein [Flavobacteriales bacterium]
MGRKYISILILILFSSFYLHEYYVSITDGKYDVKKQTLQFSIKFIGHDLEKALEKAGTPNLQLGTKSELINSNEFLLKYINSKFVIKNNGKPLQLKFIGKEINNDDDIYCYIETEKINEFGQLEVFNSLLTEVFSGQENILYLEIKEKKVNFTFNYEKTINTITF